MCIGQHVEDCRGQQGGQGFTRCEYHAESFLGHAVYSLFVFGATEIKDLVEDGPAMSGLFAATDAERLLGDGVAFPDFGDLEMDELANDL